MEIGESQRKCIEILLEGNLTMDDETGILSVDLTEDEKIYFIEYAVNRILADALVNLESIHKV